MHSTKDLLPRAVQKAASEKISARELSERLGFARNTIGTASTRDHLSATMCYKLAEYLEEDPIYWAALAGVEADHNSKARNEVLSQTTLWQKRNSKRKSED